MAVMCGHRNSCSETLFSRQKAGDEPRRVVSCDDDDDDGGGGLLCRSCRWLVVALLTAALYCCRSSHAVMRLPTLSSPAAFTAFAAPVIGWYLHCRPPPDLVIARQCAIFNSLIATLPPDALVASRRPHVPFPSMVGCCVVVCHPFSFSYPCFCKHTLSLLVNALVACRFCCQSSNLPLTLLTMVAVSSAEQRQQQTHHQHHRRSDVCEDVWCR